MDKKEIIARVIRIIKSRLPQGYDVLLFGSFARGTALETSDIDIGILGEKEVSWEIMREIQAEAEAIPTLRSIDIVDLREKSEDYRSRILRYAKPLH